MYATMHYILYTVDIFHTRYNNINGIILMIAYNCTLWIYFIQKTTMGIVYAIFFKNSSEQETVL